MTAMTYDPRNFQQDALRTEAPVSEEARKRVVRCYEIIKDAMEDAAANGEVLDKMKRYAFYLKEDDDLLEDLLPTYPTGAKRERIEQVFRLLHAWVGVQGEVGELATPILDYIENDTPLNKLNIEEEAGDILWFLNLALATVGSDLLTVMEALIRKLKERHDKKFSQAAALGERDKARELQGFANTPEVPLP